MINRRSKWVCSECGNFIYKECINERCVLGRLNQVIYGLTKEESKELNRIRGGE